ncbi:tripartite tricarboxylate transporter substrate-binding protein [Variovorax sp. LjRoot290]|uniref:tripartite tricarboxylate transporter substrate-binding protein n=1 Tax=unclassified Variovorax TaxID=663243 RepID=UPI003ECE326B
MSTRRQALKSFGATGIAAGLGFPLAAHAQAPAVETLRIVVGFPPGGTTDAFARRLAEKLRGSYAANVQVDNRSGAGGQIAVTTLRDSVADGSVMLLTPAGMLIIYPHTYPRLPYKIDDVTPISAVLYNSHGFGVGPQVPTSVKTLREFLDWAKANPNLANYGSPGAGSMPHLVAALLEKASGVPMRQIPYRGSGPGILELLSGQIASFSSPLGDYLPYLASGRLRLLALTGSTRSRFAPDVPTYAEQGFPELNMREWSGVFMPPHTPPTVVNRAHAAVRAALAQKDMIDSGIPLGMDVIGSPSPEDFGRTLKADADLWGPFVRRVGFTAES